jgi:xylose dehydrogenase (NAD/NADP)
VSGKIRWGILSTADIGLRALIPAIQNSRNGDVVAIASRSFERSKQIAEEMGIPQAYGRYLDLLEDPNIVAIYNPLPNSLHAPWTIKAIEHGKHVLCEKPLAVTPSEVDSIRVATEKTDVFAMEAVMYHFHPQTQHVIEIMRQGLLGIPQLVASAFSYNLPDPDDIRLKSDLGGGVMFDVGSYCVSVARTVFNKEPIQAFGRARIGPASDVDEVFAGILTFEDGAQSIFGCCLHGPRDQWYKITGTEASLTVPVPFAPGKDDRSLILRTGWQRDKETEEEMVVPGADQYQLMVEHFGDCITSGEEPHVSLDESRANLVVVDALLRSAREGTPIEL